MEISELHLIDGDLSAVYAGEMDYAVINAWRSERGTFKLPDAAFPPDGARIEKDHAPICYAWLYLAMGCPICWIEYVHTKPGLTLAESRKAIELAVEFLRQVAVWQEYSLTVICTSPGIAREAQRTGWKWVEGGRVSMIRETGYKGREVANG